MIKDCQSCEMYNKVQYVNMLCKYHEEGDEPFFCSTGVMPRLGAMRGTSHPSCNGSEQGSSTAGVVQRLLLFMSR